jgi:GNAT superfamily N-acetyltransferase
MSAPTERQFEIRVARDEPDVRSCWPAFKELRPHLPSEEEFVRRWRRQLSEGYAIVFVADEADVLAAAGYRVLHTLAWGRIIYVDDLIAVPSSRGSGLGRALLLHIQAEARRLGCDAVHLDTGYQRHAAHLAYLRSGFQFDCHHLAWQAEAVGQTEPRFEEPAPAAPGNDLSISPARGGGFGR